MLNAAKLFLIYIIFFAYTWEAFSYLRNITHVNQLCFEQLHNK